MEGWEYVNIFSIAQGNWEGFLQNFLEVDRRHWSPLWIGCRPRRNEPLCMYMELILMWVICHSIQKTRGCFHCCCCAAYGNVVACGVQIRLNFHFLMDSYSWKTHFLFLCSACLEWGEGELGEPCEGTFYRCVGATSTKARASCPQRTIWVSPEQSVEKKKLLLRCCLSLYAKKGATLLSD